MIRNDTSDFLGYTDTLLVIIGPSGSGKTKLSQALAKNETIEVTPSWTTRQRRKNDEDASDHVFVDDKNFQELNKRGFFLETTQLFGLPYRYGLPRVRHTDRRKIPTILIRSMLLPLAYRHYSSIVVYQIESARPLVKKRLLARGGGKIDIANRLVSYDKEIRQGRKSASRVFVNDTSFEDLLQSVTATLKKDFL